MVVMHLGENRASTLRFAGWSGRVSLSFFFFWFLLVELLRRTLQIIVTTVHHSYHFFDDHVFLVLNYNVFVLIYYDYYI